MSEIGAYPEKYKIGIHQRKNGTWEVRATVILADGTKKRRSFYKKTKGEAQSFKVVLMGRANTTGGVLYDEDVEEMLAIINRVQNRENRPDEQQQQPEGTTLADYLDRWLTESVRHRVRASSYAAYSYRISRYVIPAIGEVQLRDLTWQHLQRLYNDLLDSGLSPATVKTVHVVLHKALKQAVRWELVDQNVADAVDPPRVEREEVKALGAKQVVRLLEAARGDRLEALYVLAVTTGLRRGELLGLRWEDVDLAEGVVRVRQALTAEGTITRPKNARSRRVVALTPAAIDAMQRHADRQRDEGNYDPDGLVFTTTSGTPINVANLRVRSFKPLLQRAGLPDIPFHALRHTAATLMLGAGVHPKIAADMLGHASTQITLDVYSHATPGMHKQAAEAIGVALRGLEARPPTRRQSREDGPK
ncbi:MAG TPA: site-specific integrase [Rubrobacteraceae bacterium]|nr:site-specific integrase [Rubrobacteraceae bacterium]